MHFIWGLVSLLTYQRVAVSGPAPGICLTFDDGPDPEHTPRLLDLLRRHDVAATFFMVGRFIEEYPELVARMAADGHRIGNHSYSHKSFASLPLREQVAEIRKTEAVLSRIDGRHGHPFRPPNGRLTPALLAWCLLHRQRIVLWTHDSLDFRLSAADVFERVSKMTFTPGSILVFHDDAAVGLAALERLIPQWRETGYQFATL